MASRAITANRVKRTKRAKAPKPLSAGEEAFALHCRAHHLPSVTRELAFALEAFGRRWKFDFAWPEYRVAVECEGLVVRFQAGKKILLGRHVTLEGFEEDAIKYAHAALLGWTVLRFNQRLIGNGTAIDLTRRVLAAKGWSNDG